MKCWIFFNADGWNADGDTSIADQYGEVAKLMISFFHNSVNELGLQPRIGPVQQGPGEGSREGSAEGLGGFGTEPGQFRRRFRRRSGRIRWKVPGEGLGGFGAEPGQVQQGSGEGSGEGLGGFGPVRFNKVPKKVPGEGLRLWCRARSGSTGFPRRFGEGPGRVPEKVWEASVQVQPVRFNKVPKKVPGEGLGGFGAEPGQVQQGSEKVPGRVPEKVSEKVWEDPVQLVRFNKVPKKVPGEGLQVQQGSGEGSEKVPGRFPEKVWEDSVEGSRRRSGRLWCRARSSSTGFRRRFGESSRKRERKAKSALVRRRRGRLAALVQSQVRFKGICSHFFIHGNPAEVFPALGFAARFRKI